MNKRVAKAAAKHVSAAEAAALVTSRSCLSIRPVAIFEADPESKHFQSYNWHFSGYDRLKHDAGRCNYIPLNLGEVPDYSAASCRRSISSFC